MSEFESSTVHQAPRFSEKDAVEISRDLFGVEGEVHPLPSERDQNFKIRTASGEIFVLKIANPAENLAILELQNQALEKVASAFGRPQLLANSLGDPCPRVCTASGGERILAVAGADGARHFVRLLTYLPGTPLAEIRPHDSGLLESLGVFLGGLDRALEGFDHPAAHRDFYWDLKNASRVVGEYGARIEEPRDRKLVEQFLSLYESKAAPMFAKLRQSVIHNDGNDHNLLVRRVRGWEHRVSAVLDFGDMVRTVTVAEPAIAAAYAMMGKADPLAAATRVVAGYHSVLTLQEDEIAVLFPLICARLIMSVSISAEQRYRRPSDDYLSISEKPAWELLRKLKTMHPHLIHYSFRHACGLEPCPKSSNVVGWLRKERKKIGTVVGADLSKVRSLVFDLSVGSPGASAMNPDDRPPGKRKRDPQVSTDWIFEQMQAAGVTVGIGRYDEPRRCYTASQFEQDSDELPETRTIHLGIDLFQKAGSPVLAPLDGKIHSFRDNDSPLDYGPTIILEHEAAPTRFYTLYGHLSRESLKGLVVGTSVKKGAQIGTMGDTSVNGGWPPHLHFQLLTDLLGESGNYPGVAAPSQRKVWLSLCPDPNLILGIPETTPAETGSPPEIILEKRRAHLGKALSVSYRQPLKIVRGAGQYLYDELGRAYLDCVNNVCHVGHCHPKVVRAGQSQMGVLNTNTRYLHDTIVRYAERLASKMPDPLEVCFLVCSGSEANELALRMARAHTLRRDIICVEGGYHGNTQTLIDVSSYKFDGPGGVGSPAYVHKVPMPDGYRGLYRGHRSETGAQYAEHVRQVAAQIQDPNDHRGAGGGTRALVSPGETPGTTPGLGPGVAAFICESILSCGGQIVLPEGYLSWAYAHVRAAGGVCIADEVQVGFGRVGSHFWGFETQGVVPDIVTLGKPIGNGHPLAAVVTTREIADSFANGMEYFNTFGGNPVSCAVGMAVLDVIEEEKLQENARTVGEYLLRKLGALQERHPLIGDVRGMGMFLGLELVRDADAREPAPDHASHLVERMKDHGVLLSTDGPRHNVIKIKPPLVFDKNNADYLVRTLDKVLGEDVFQLPNS